MKHVLTIAGSDSCAGAGIQADLKTMSALGVYGLSIVSAITAQNTQGVFKVSEVSKKMLQKQIEVIFEDIRIDCVKIGMLLSSKTIKTVAKNLKKYKAKNIVIDPVMVSSSNFRLLENEALCELKKLILLATVLTPNIPEAQILASMEIKNEKDMKKACEKIKTFGAKNILIKGGHRKDNCTDILMLENGNFVKFKGKRIDIKNVHGTGCVLSSAIASYLAKGFSVEKSVEKAKIYITNAIKNSFSIGKGARILRHFNQNIKIGKI